MVLLLPVASMATQTGKEGGTREVGSGGKEGHMLGLAIPFMQVEDKTGLEKSFRIVGHILNRMSVKSL